MGWAKMVILWDINYYGRLCSKDLILFQRLSKHIFFLRLIFLDDKQSSAFCENIPRLDSFGVRVKILLNWLVQVLTICFQQKFKTQIFVYAACLHSEADMVDSKVFIISRLAQWRIDNFGPSNYKKSEPFTVGLWNWIFTVETSHRIRICLFTEPSEQPPFARYVLRVFDHGPNSEPLVSRVYERVIHSSADFTSGFDVRFKGLRLTIDVEFLDLQIVPLNGVDLKSIWPNYGIENISTQATLNRVARMFFGGIHADATIVTADGRLNAHKAVLSASSPIFSSMFHYDMKEKETSTIEIKDYPVEICYIMLSYLYGTIKREDFWKFRISLLEMANKYFIPDLKHACEESLLEDIDLANVLRRLHLALKYKLDELKKGCLAYLFDFGEVNEIKAEMKDFYRSCRFSDREMATDILKNLLRVRRD